MPEQSNALFLQIKIMEKKIPYSPRYYRIRLINSLKLHIWKNQCQILKIRFL